LGIFSKTALLVHDKFKEGAMGEVCSKHETDEECMQRFLSESQQERDHWEELVVGGRIMSRVGSSVINNNGFWIGLIDGFFAQSLLITITTALSLIYTLSSSTLHMH
jgi:hypothetical protein